ncbi:restriction endonuclease [Streptomyces sp. 2333.5]|uniref:restriction endonuclease n=1 Tax=unclassified Streptomyces TaxID=2593676 RepID=UPI0008959CB5|nr:MULTISPECIES: restriction endonuclease [unclassified Streptomyces]PJJ02807.1 restriction endonuclease [Streptomyces sp. 2333.5]SED28064.1 Restriction endonuclease [Streptomyces sp. 2314.4]SEE15646.1 Restriction endonuclease [Streptomyces sp. 2112.2]
MGGNLRVGQVFRYASGKDPNPPTLDGYANFHHVTHSPDLKRALLESGINGMAKVSAIDGERRPVILIRSSPWKAGTEQTPWHDVFDLDNGHVRYFGDHKAGITAAPGTTTGNAALLEAFNGHQAPTPEERASATPLLLFRAVSRNGKPKGHVEFCGLGVIERAERLVQWGGREHTTFTNYVYDIALIDLTAESDEVSWEWIHTRRDKTATAARALDLAPCAWREWVKHGNSALPRLRRRVARAKVSKVRDQRPAAGSSEAADLEAVYRRFDGRKHDFEALASAVAARVMRGSGHSYVEGWLTRRSGDGGADFVGRLDLGSGLAGTSLVVLGQAKCIKPDSLVSAEQIARVVARLRRGWIDVYVTTGAYSEPAQMEMVEDQYPIVLINGMDLVRELRSMARDDHGGDLPACIDHILSGQETAVTSRRPEEILLE